MQKAIIMALVIAVVLCIIGLGIAALVASTAIVTVQNEGTAFVATMTFEATQELPTRQFNIAATATAAIGHLNDLHVTNRAIDAAIDSTYAAQTKNAPTPTPAQ